MEKTYFTVFVFLLWIIYVCFCCFCVRLFIDALWSPAGKGLTSWLSFLMSYCKVVIFPLVSWVRCGAWLYRFLIFVDSWSLPYFILSCNMGHNPYKIQSSIICLIGMMLTCKIRQLKLWSIGLYDWLQRVCFCRENSLTFKANRRDKQHLSIIKRIVVLKSLNKLRFYN